jgi:hypothetical protein
MREKDALGQIHENKIKNLVQQNEKYVKEDYGNRVRNLEMENLSLKNQKD